MEPLDPESAQIREVYAKFGLALYQTQCIERSLSILLATRYGPGVGRTTQKEYEDLLASLFRKTFGGVVTEFRKRVRDLPEFDSNLDFALDKRNWLAHRYFWERAGHFMSEEGREAMLVELQGLIDILNNLHEQIQQTSFDWWNEVGLDYSVLVSEAARLIDEGRSGK